MRKRRIDARTRVITRACIAGECGPAEPCELLSPRLSWDRELVADEDYKFVHRIAGEASLLPVGPRRDDWHPDFIAPKLEALARLESQIDAEVKAICGRILQTMELRRMEKEAL